MAAPQLNRVETTKLMKGLVEGLYGEAQRAHQEGKLVAWIVGPFPYELLRAMDITFVQLENYAAARAARKVTRDVIDAVEHRGYSPDVCSYTKIGLGQAVAHAQHTCPMGGLPEPDMVLCCNPCYIMNKWYALMVRHFGVPCYIVDIPYLYRVPGRLEGIADEERRYVLRQIKEGLIPFLEERTGRRLDYDRLREIVALVKEAARLRRAAYELGKHIPTPITVFDAVISLGAVNVCRGTPGSVEYFARLKAELEERIAQGIAAVPNEEYRLYWDNINVWFKLKEHSELFASHGAAVLGGIYTHATFYWEWEQIDPDRPLEALSQEQLEVFLTRNLQWRLNFIAQMVEEYSLDGLLMHSSRTCRPIDMGQYDMVEELERRLGMPGIVIDADHSDERLYSDAQFRNRVQAFMETLANRKKPRALVEIMR